ncbi:MAG: glycosyltransferase family 2 protein [Candidatus Omnitrophica bacterium]|nr:glycosyltransferase family 2 protein [Candidatus Omnitrophota bacterium]MDD5236197.1 glycosyltransferase family 2 protein [Candidatus Omnitrophota bacterium]MDD5610172.1 glycosyltransferase family 2 protein [Candidatus Omnitrophota bacterium]
MDKRRSAAILVLNYNCRQFLKDCLDSVAAQTYKDFSLFLIDNDSSDESLAFVKENFPSVTIIQNPANFGFGKGFNSGIRRVLDGFTYIALLNADLKLEKEWLGESIKTLESDSRAQVCSSLVLDWEGKNVESAGGTIVNLLTGIFGGFLAGLPFKSLPAEYKNKEFPVFYGIANAILVRSGAFREFGLFDEEYFMYFEDVDFSWRVLISGGKVLCNPRAIVYHFGHGASTSKKLSLKLLQQTETNLLATYFKNLSTPDFLLLFLPLAVSRAIFSLFYIFISPRITLTKIKGILVFALSLLKGKYKKDRAFVSRIRKLNDRRILAINPTGIFSFLFFTSTAQNWFRTIRAVYNRKEGAAVLQ